MNIAAIHPNQLLMQVKDWSPQVSGWLVADYQWHWKKASAKAWRSFCGGGGE